MTDLKPYTSGYMKPPKEHRFKKGKSGNPKGRPKRKETLHSISRRVLNKKIRIKGEPRKVSMLEAIALRLRELAAKGNPRALRIMRRYARHSEIAADQPPEEWNPHDETALNILGLTVVDGEIVPIEPEIEGET